MTSSHWHSSPQHPAASLGMLGKKQRIKGSHPSLFKQMPLTHVLSVRTCLTSSRGGASMPQEFMNILILFPPSFRAPDQLPRKRGNQRGKRR